VALTGAKFARAAKTELARRARANRLTPPGVKIRDVCHPKQASLVESLVLGRARNVSVGAGRQSGKSHGAALAVLLVAAGVPGVNLIYVASTITTCKRMAFNPAVELNRTHGLGGDPKYGAELSISFPNGSNIYFLGADSEKTIDRLRGVPNLVMCIIDEASIYKPASLQEMIKAVRPGLRPRRGKLCVMGTGSKQGKQGTWYDIKQNPEYEQHRFDYEDNDRVPSYGEREALIDEDLRAQFKEIGLGAMTLAEARSSAWFKREYKGEDVIELSEQAYKITEDNLVDIIPEEHEQYATGGDIGVKASDALVSAGWSGEAREVWIVDQEEASGQDSIACADMVNSHNEKRHPIVVALDAGGLGGKTIKTVQNLYPDVPVVEAVKPPIGIQVRAVNTLAARGRLKIKRGSRLALELVGTTWVDDIVGGKLDEHGGHSDLAPGLRYLCVKLLALLPGLEEPAAPPTADEVRAARIAAALKRAQKPHPDDDERGSEPGGQDFEPASPWD